MELYRILPNKKGLREDFRKVYKLLNSISNSSTDAIYVKDIHGKYLLLNDEGCKVVGKTQKEVIGKDDYNLFPSEEAKEVMEGDRKIMESGEVNTHEEVTSTKKGIRTFLSVKGPIYNSDGKVSGLFGVARDITERKKMEDVLKYSERLLNESQRLCKNRKLEF